MGYRFNTYMADHVFISWLCSVILCILILNVFVFIDVIVSSWKKRRSLFARFVCINTRGNLPEALFQLIISVSLLPGMLIGNWLMRKFYCAYIKHKLMGLKKVLDKHYSDVKKTYTEMENKFKKDNV